MIFHREETNEKKNEKKKRNTPIRRGEFKEPSLSPRISNPADETFHLNLEIS